MLVSLDNVIVVLIISAGMLAFVVLYNLNNINITERKRELATLKVLGFYNSEVCAYVYRENVILTLIGALFGIILGKILHQFIIVTVEIESVDVRAQYQCDQLRLRFSSHGRLLLLCQCGDVF